MTNALLLAEPEPTLARHLADDGFDVVGAGSGDAAALAASVDLALVGDLDLCRRLGKLPVIVLGGEEADVVDRVRAFEHGADDFVPRPFHYEELLARIRALLRRTGPAGLAGVVEVDGLCVDLHRRRVTVGDDLVDLAGKEYALLARLASDPDRVFTKAELLREIWGYGGNLRTRTLDSHASRVRRKIERPGFGPFVVNQWGVGYRLVKR